MFLYTLHVTQYYVLNFNTHWSLNLFNIRILMISDDGHLGPNMLDQQ